MGSKRKFLKRFKSPLSLICAYLFVGGIITAMVAIIIPELISSVESLAESLPEYGRQAEELFNNIIAKLDEILHIDNPDEENTILALINQIFTAITDGDLSNFITNITSEIIPSAFTATKAFIGEVYNWVIAIVISIYLLLNKYKLQQQFKKIICAYCKPKTQNKIFEIIDLINNKCGRFIIGKIVDSTIIGILCFIGMSILHLEYASIISVVIGVTNIIPVFGPIIGAIPSAFLLLIIDPMQCLWFVIFIIVLQQIDGNIIGPKILGDQIGLSGFWIMFSVIVGGGLFGVGGMILGVPIFAVIYSLLGNDVNKRLKEKCASASADAPLDEEITDENVSDNTDPE